MAKTWIEYFRLPVSLEIGDETREEIWGMKPDAPSKVKVFGKEYDTPRLQRAYGKSYSFSGSVAEAAEPIPEMFMKIVDFLNKRYHRNFNMMLINWYRDGNDYISMHSDDENQLKENSPVVTISLGVERDFVLKNMETNERNVYNLENNSVLTMGGTCQKTHKHGLPVRKKVTDYRISLTFREFS
tara:strand:- start:17 stop:571 length:555 start_codon:yes stop_codon:yes gene_type:complete